MYKQSNTGASNWREASSAQKKETSKRSNDGWTSVSSNNNNRNTKQEFKPQNKEYELKKKFFQVTSRIDDIMSTNTGTVNDIENKCIAYFNTLRSKEEKAKAIETIVSYSLHEIINETSFFGKIISSDLSTKSNSIGLIKEKDGYDIFTWAIWTRYGDKRSIANIPRDNSDIIKMVNALLALEVSPFHVNTKKESLIKTMNSCLGNGKITQDTYDEIYEILLKQTNSNFIFKCLSNNIFDINREGILFEKSLVTWGLTLPDVREKIIDMMFRFDIDQVSLSEINRKTGEMSYEIMYHKMINILRSKSYHSDFTKYFAENPINNDEIIRIMTSRYLDNIFNLYPKIYEFDVTAGYSGCNGEGKCFKHLETLGALIWDMSKYTDFDINMLNDMHLKVQIGFGLHGLNANNSNIEYLKKLYTNCHIVSKILIENAFQNKGIQFGEYAELPKKVVVEKKEENPLQNFKTGLEKIGNNKINFTTNAILPCVEDAVYSMSKISTKVDNNEMCRAFIYQACCELSHDNQINHIAEFINYLDSKSIMKRENIKRIISEEEEEIIEITSCDNPKVNRIINIIKNI